MVEGVIIVGGIFVFIVDSSLDSLRSDLMCMKEGIMKVMASRCQI